MKEKEGERQVGPGKLVLACSTSMDVNWCFSASMSADLHNGYGILNTETPLYSFAISAGKAHPQPWTSLFA